MATDAHLTGHVRLRERQDALFDLSISGSLRALQSAMPLLFEETPGAEGGSTPQPQAAGIKAVFSPLQGKNTQTPDFSWAPRKESVTTFGPRPLPRNLGGRPRKDHLRARVDGDECHIRADKKARTHGGGVPCCALQAELRRDFGAEAALIKGKGRSRCRQLRSSWPLSHCSSNLINVIHVNTRVAQSKIYAC